MNKFFSLLAATTIGMSSFAQTGGKVSGTIKDGGNQKIIDAATVSLIKAKDSSLVKAAVTDQSGSFVFENVKNGIYLVRATSIGHSKSYSSSFTISEANPSSNVGILQLVPVDKSMKEVDKALDQLNSKVQSVDWNKISADVNNSLSRININKMKEDIRASMKKIDWERVNGDVKRSLNDANVEIQKAMKIIDSQMNSEKIKSHREELKKDMEELKKDLQKNKEELQKDIKKTKV